MGALDNAMTNAMAASFATNVAVLGGAALADVKTGGKYGITAKAVLASPLFELASGYTAIAVTNDPNEARKKAASGALLLQEGIGIGGGVAGAFLGTRSLPSKIQRALKAENVSQIFGKGLNKFNFLGKEVMSGFHRMPDVAKGYMGGMFAADAASAAVVVGGSVGSLFMGDGSRHNSVIASNRGEL